jgi:ketosteroid isomerase-like protein
VGGEREALENVEVVRRFFDARNDGGDDYLAYVSTDAEFDVSESQSPYRGVYCGHEEIRELFRVQREVWETVEWQLEDPLAVGESVLVSVRFRVRGGASGIETGARSANVYTLAGGLITRFKMFQTRPEAAASLGVEA